MLSILIVNWNTRELLRRCLMSIQEFAPKSPYEIIVVDNASSDGSAQMVADEFPSVRLEKNPNNVGYAAANNQAFRLAKGDLLLTLNPDTEFFDDSLDKLVFPDSDVGCLAAKLVDSPGASPQRSIRRFPRPILMLLEILGLHKGYRALDFDYSRPGEAEQAMGTFVLFRKEALDAVGLMDERFPIFFNDVDLLYRLRLAGWRTWYSPDVQVIHHGGASTKQVRKSMIWESHRSLIRYYWKWYSRWWSWPLLVLFSAVVWLGALVRAGGWDAGSGGLLLSSGCAVLR